MQKINIIHQPILESHDLKGHTFIFDHGHPTIIIVTFSFPKFVSACSKSVYSIDSFFRSNQSHSTTLYQMQKNRLFHHFILRIYLIQKSCNLIGQEHFDPYPRNYIFSQIWGFRRKKANNINFPFKPN